MALTGASTTNSYDGRYYQVAWDAIQSIDNNKSTITWTLACWGGAASWYAERTLKVVVAGQTVYSKEARVERYTGQIATGTVTVSHNAEGNASFSISIQAAVYTSTINCTSSDTFTLNQIPRKSTLSVGNGTLNTAQTLTVTRKSTSFTHTITATCGSASTTICTKSSSTSISFTPPLSWASQNTTGTSLSVKYTITTYNGNTSIGSNSYTVTCSIPSSVKPSCSITISDPTGYLSTYGGYVKTKSKFQVSVRATTSYGSAISSYSTTANGSTYTASSFTTGVLKSSGTLTISAKVTDKRGRSGTASVNVTVLDYIAPVISNLTLVRSGSDGTEDPQGEYITIYFDASVTSLNNKNTARYKIQHKKSADSTWTDYNLDFHDNEYSLVNCSALIVADTESSYDVRFIATDAFSTTSRTTVASTAFSLMHFKASGTGIGFGKISELDNTAEFALDGKFYGKVYGNAVGVSGLDSIPSNSDLNDYLETGCFAVQSTTAAKTMTNIPLQLAGRLFVADATGQEKTASYNGMIYRRQTFVPYDYDYPTLSRDMIKNSDTGAWSYRAWYGLAKGDCINAIFSSDFTLPNDITKCTLRNAAAYSVILGVTNGEIKTGLGCIVNISGQVYLTTGYNVDDLVHLYVYLSTGALVLRAIKRITAVNPYVTLHFSCRARLKAGDTIIVKMINESGARGGVSSNASYSFINVVADRFYAYNN